MIYVMFIVEKTIPDIWTGKALVREAFEQAFYNETELQNYIIDNFKSKPWLKGIEKYNGLCTTFKYIYRISYDDETI